MSRFTHAHAKTIQIEENARMATYEITRTRLVTERYRIEATNEDEAVDILSSDEESCEQIEESTIHSEIEVRHT